MNLFKMAENTNNIVTKPSFQLMLTLVILVLIVALLVTVNDVFIENKFSGKTECVLGMFFIVIMVFCYGMGGGIISADRRYKNLTEEEKKEISRDTFISNYLSPGVIGGIFALFLMLLFAGEIIQGELFPDYSEDHKEDEEAVKSLSCLLDIPDKTKDTVKLWVWSFIAGFSERLVPNMLKKLAGRISGN